MAFDSVERRVGERVGERAETRVGERVAWMAAKKADLVGNLMVDLKG